MAHLKLQVENGLEVASLLSIVAVAREWREAMYRLPAPSALTHVGWFIMLIVSFPGLHQASLQYCKKRWAGPENETNITNELECFFEKI